MRNSQSSTTMELTSTMPSHVGLSRKRRRYTSLSLSVAWIAGFCFVSYNPFLSRVILCADAGRSSPSVKNSKSLTKQNQQEDIILKGGHVNSNHRKNQDTSINNDYNGVGITFKGDEAPVRLFRSGILRKKGHEKKDGDKYGDNNDDKYRDENGRKCGKSRKGKSAKEYICNEQGHLLPGYTSFYPTPSTTYTPTVWDVEGVGYPSGTEDVKDQNDIKDQNDVVDSSPDSDSDGLTDVMEIFHGTDPYNPDSDGDGLDDGLEINMGTNPLNPDSDGDGLNDSQEFFLNTDPLKPDTDGDGYSDNEEVLDGSSPLDPNSVPGDDVLDYKNDADGDGLLDEEETGVHNTNPNKEDTDGDGLTDGEEVNIYGTDPNNADSDGDGVPDGIEVDIGLDPLSPIAGTVDPNEPSPGCDAFKKGDVYTTGARANVHFIFEAAIDPDADIDTIADRLEGTTAKYVGNALIRCEPWRNLRDGGGFHGDQQLVIQSGNSQHRRSLLVDGVDSNPKDIVTREPCTYFVDDQAIPETSCYVIHGFMTLYLRENTALSSSLESSSKALKALQTAFNKVFVSPFLEGQGEYSINGLVGIRYVGGTPDQGQNIDNSGNDVLNPPTLGGASARVSAEESEEDSLSPVGIALISVGGLAIIGVALVATRKRKRYKEDSYAEFDDDNFDDLDGDKIADNDSDTVASTTLGVTPSPKKKSKKSQKKAYVYGEEDSIFSSGTELRDIVDDLRASEGAAGNKIHFDDRHDVHQCKSATCPKCNSSRQAGPVFIQAYDDGEDSVVESGFEFPNYQYSPGMASPLPSSLSYNSRSPTPKSPTYDNPANIGQSPESKRGYVIEDTVEF